MWDLCAEFVYWLLYDRCPGVVFTSVVWIWICSDLCFFCFLFFFLFHTLCVFLLIIRCRRAACFVLFLWDLRTPSLHAVQRRLIFSICSLLRSIGTTDYIGSQRSIDTGRLPAPLGATDIRPAQVFHDAHTIPSANSASPSMAPLLRDNGLGSLSRHPAIATSSRMAAAPPDLDEQSPTNEELFGQLPDGKRRTFILVEDPQRGSRVRVKVGLDKVKMDEIPDSYRKNNAVYPRTYFPTQMKDAPLLVDPSKRFFAEDIEHMGDPEDSTIGRTTVPAPSMDGERGIDVPKLSRRRHRKEVMLNDLAYRLSWSQSRVFAGRMLFLQRSRKLPFLFVYGI